MRIALCILSALLLTAFSTVGGIPAAMTQSTVPAEYLQTFVAEGRDPTWRATVRPGEARITIDGQPERIIPLLPAKDCFVVGCEGVMIEQDVSHRHHGASITKQACRLTGSDEVFPYRITVSVLASPRDRQGVNYRGCGRPAS